MVAMVSIRFVYVTQTSVGSDSPPMLWPLARTDYSKGEKDGGVYHKSKV